MTAFVRFSIVILTVLICCYPASTLADTVYLPGPRIDIPSMSPRAFAAISTRRQATRFMRRDDGPRYVIYGDSELS